MPAIQIARLRKEIAELSRLIDSPETFIGRLTALLDSYANRTQRPGESGIRTVIAAYHVPTPVLRHLQRELVAQSRETPELMLIILDRLWAQNNLECRLLAAKITGNTAGREIRAQLDRIEKWYQENDEETIQKSLTSESITNLARQEPNTVEDRIAHWLSTQNFSLRRLGLSSLQGLLANPEFQDLPWLLDVLAPFLRQTGSGNRDYVLGVVKSLAVRSPQELIYHFQTSLQTADHPDTAWLIRNSLFAFHPDYHSALRSLVRISR